MLCRHGLPDVIMVSGKGCWEKVAGKDMAEKKEIPIRAEFALSGVFAPSCMRRPPIRAGLKVRAYQQGT
jgi:hypothetical protein